MFSLILPKLKMYKDIIFVTHSSFPTLFSTSVDKPFIWRQHGYGSWIMSMNIVESGAKHHNPNPIMSMNSFDSIIWLIYVAIYI